MEHITLSKYLRTLNLILAAAEQEKFQCKLWIRPHVCHKSSSYIIRHPREKIERHGNNETILLHAS